MVTISGVTPEKLAQIDAKSIVNADVVGNNLVLTRRDFSTITLGSIRGTTGITTPPLVYEMFSGSTQSLANNTTTIVTSWTFAKGLSTLLTYDGVGSFTITQDGLYIVNGRVGFNANTAGRRVVMLWKNSTDMRRAEYPANTHCNFQTQHIMNLVAGDVLTLRAYQGSGAALNLYGSSSLKHRFSCIKVA